MIKCQKDRIIQLETNLNVTLNQIFNKIERIKEQHSHNQIQYPLTLSTLTLKSSFSTQVSHTLNSPSMQDSQSSLKFPKKKLRNFYIAEQSLTFNKKYSQNTQIIKKPKRKKLQVRSCKSLNLNPVITSLQDIITKEVQQINIDNVIKQNDESKILTKIVNISDFQLGRCLGSGKFGDVYLCRHRITSSVYALKKIFKSTIKQYNMVSQLAQELKIHQKLDHPNIIKLYGYFDDQYHIFLILQYCDGGNLMSKLHTTQSQVSKITSQILQAVSYLHKRRIIHRDIKPQNIMICQNKTVKICDFGWSCFMNGSMKTTFCGTLDYLSPQMKDIGQYTESVDLWSIGILVYQLLYGQSPFKNQLQKWKANVPKCNLFWNWQIRYPCYFSNQSSNFMQLILRKNPKQRANANQCKNHSFIVNHRQNPSLFDKEFNIILH